MVTKKIYTDLDVGGQIKANSIIFNPNAVDVTRELGETYWDPSTQSLITHQNNKHLNHGEELWVPLCYNNSGGVILNGQPVYINSSTGGYPTIELASSTTYEKARLIGVATEDILNGETGRITRFGYINDLDLTGLTSGSEVYLGHFALTGTRPTGGNYPVTVGKVIVGGNPGKLLVYPQSVQYTAEINNVTGFPSNLNGDNTTISFSDATRTLTINPTGSSYHYYISGVKYIKTSDSIQITDDEGCHVIYYNGATLTEAINPTKEQVYNIFSAYAPVTVISWDSTNNTAKFASDDRHTISWPSTLVAHDHTVFGTLYIGEYNPTGVVIGNGSLESHAQFGVDAGSILNEDIFTSSTAIGSTVGLPIFYRSGPSGSFVWRKTTRSGYSFLNDGTTGLMQYNLLTGGNWTLASATNNYITFVHVFALNNLISENVIALMGTKEYSSLSNAEAGIGTEITEIMNNIKTYVVPIRHLYSFIYETKSSFANTVKARIIQTSTSKDFLDFRTSAVSVAVGGGGTGSSTFVGLSDVPDSYASHQNKLIKVNASEIGVEFSAATIDTNNNFNTPGTITGTQLISTTAGGTSPLTVTSTTKVTNLNVDLLDSYHADVNSTANTIPVRNANKAITSDFFIRTGGTSSQFLKADGSIDSSVYLTSYTETDPIYVASSWYTTTNNSSNWNTAYTQRLQWDGGASNLVAATGRTSLGGTTIGQNLFTLTNPSAVTFPRFNADNTISALSAADFRTAIGAGTSSTTGTVTSVGGTGSVSGITLSGTVTTSGNLTLGGTLSVLPSNFASQTANTVLAAPNGSNGTPSFRALVAADIPNIDASKITSGTIDAARLPSYVDDVLEFTNLANFPVTGEAGKIYVALDTNKTYRWGGSSYVYITSGAVDSVGGYTGVVTASNLLSALLTVDGTGSGLDADLLDGIESSAFQLALTNPVTANSASFTAGYLTKSTGTGVQIQLTGVSVDSSNNMYVPGKLGINVTPTSKLHAVDGTVAELKFNSGASDLTPSLAVGNTGASGKFAGLIAGTSGAVFEYDSAGYFAISSNTKTNYTNGTLGGGTRRLVITSGGAVMIGSSTAPTAWLHIQAGTASAGTAPIKLNSGTNLTNPEAGALEYDGTNIYFTPSAARRTFAFLDSPAFTGAPTVPTADPGTNNTQAASTAFVTAAVAAAGGGGGGLTYDFELSENINVGNIVQLLTNGKIEKVQSVSVSQSIPSSSGYAPTSYSANYYDLKYLSSDKFVLAWNNGGYGYSVIGTISGTTVSFGSTYTFNSQSTYNLKVAVDKNTPNSFVIAFRDAANSNYGTAIVGTVNGTVITYGSKYVFFSNFCIPTSIEFNPNETGKFVIGFLAYDPNYYGTVIAGSVAGTALTFTSQTWVETVACAEVVIAFDKNVTGSFVIAWRDNNNYLSLKTATINSSNSITANAKYGNMANSTVSGIAIRFNPFTSNSFIVLYMNEIYASGRIKLGTVSGTALSVTDTSNGASYASSPYSTAFEFDPNTSGRIVISYATTSGSVYAIVGTISGTSITFGTAFSIGSGWAGVISFDKPNGGKFAVMYGSGLKLGQLASTATNLSSAKLLGVLTATGTTGQIKKVSLLGGIDSTRSGLTPGSLYYVQPDGSVSTTSDAPAVYYGRAISTTAILTKQIWE